MISLELSRRSAGSTSASQKPRPIWSYAELQEQMHQDLLAQNPDWIDADGGCAKCEDYDRRFAELVTIFRAVNLKPVRQAA
jgi:hypothetical protein